MYKLKYFCPILYVHHIILQFRWCAATCSPPTPDSKSTSDRSGILYSASPWEKGMPFIQFMNPSGAPSSWISSGVWQMSLQNRGLTNSPLNSKVWRYWTQLCPPQITVWPCVLSQDTWWKLSGSIQSFELANTTSSCRRAGWRFGAATYILHRQPWRRLWYSSKTWTSVVCAGRKICVCGCQSNSTLPMGRI